MKRAPLLTRFVLADASDQHDKQQTERLKNWPFPRDRFLLNLFGEMMLTSQALLLVAASVPAIAETVHGAVVFSRHGDRE